MRDHSRSIGSLHPEADPERPDRSGTTDPLRSPRTLPGRQQEFDMFGSALHSFVGFQRDAHEHVNVDVTVYEDRDR